MQTVTIAVENLFQLRATMNVPGKSFAFYLYHNGTVVMKSQYGSSNSHKFGMTRAGVYQVKGYSRTSSGEVESAMSERVRYRPTSDIPPVRPQKPIAIMGVTLSSAFAAHVLAERGVVAFVDPTGQHVGTDFFERPVLAEAPADVVLIGHENYLSQHPDLLPFSLAPGSVDVLSQQLHKLGVMELYRLSRSAYLEGFESGAYYIQGFIFGKFNCRVPFLARIGEGTRLGIGGIGAVIHPRSIIGKDCVIAQNVTLGSRAGGNGTPVIGNNVFIAPGAKCFGGKIGSNVVVGANAVVLDEIPDNCVVAGVPARIISRDIEKYKGYTARPPRK